MTIAEYLNTKANLHAREELFNHKLLFDLKAASAVRGYHLQTYYSDVDHDGFDVIFDDADNLRKIQLKTVGPEAETSSWDIHKCIIRPTANNYEQLGFNFEGFWGVEGGVILIQYAIDSQEEITTTYYFTDIYIINAIALGLIPRHGNTKNAAIAARAQAAIGGSHDQMGITKGLFVKTATPQHLLCLIGMHSTLQRPGWQHRVRHLSSEEWGPKGEMLPEVLSAEKAEFPAIMVEVTGCTDM